MKVVFTSATAEFLYLWNTYMKYISQFPTWALFNPSKGLVIPKRGSFVPLKGYFFPKWGSWSLISFFRSTGVITLNIASSSFRCRSRAVTLANWQIFEFELIRGHHQVQFVRQLAFALVFLTFCCYTVLTRPNSTRSKQLAFSLGPIMSLSR